jgi:hypothetical protein
LVFSYFHTSRSFADSVGRWTTYVFVFHRDQEEYGGPYNQMKDALQDFNIEIVEIDQLQNVSPRPAKLWSLIDPQPSQHATADLQTLDGKEALIPLQFEIRYQLEVCISQEIFNEHNINREFVARLAEITSSDITKAKNILEYVVAQGKRIFDPMTIFDNQDALAYSPKSEIPHYSAYARKANVTPSTIYFSTPTVETTNRVLRHYARENNEGRFLRVQFTDEMAEVLLLFLQTITTNKSRVVSTLAPINNAMMSSLIESTEPCSMEFESEIDTTSSLPLGTLSFERMEHAFSAQLITCLVMTSADGWATFHISKLLPDTLLDSANASPRLAPSTGY